MTCPLPNTTAQAVGFIIPGRSSSLQDHSTRPLKRSKKSSLDRSRHEVAERMRGISLGSRLPKVRNKISFDGSHIARGQFVKRTSSWTSSSSSSPPVSVYKNYHGSLIDRNDDLLRQTSMNIKTFRAAGVPDPRHSPDISAHPAHSLPASPVDSLSSLEAESDDAQSSATISATHANGSGGPPVDAIPPPSLPPAPSPKRIEDSAIHVNRISAVVHQSRLRPIEDAVQEALRRHIHLFDPHRRIKPVKQTMNAPVQHFATCMEGKIIKIPGALGQSLEIFRQGEPKVAFTGMGWD